VNRYVPARSDFIALARLAAPIVVTQVGLMLMGVVDILMVGHVSATALAAVALANLYLFGVSTFGLGTLFALDPIVSQALGANDRLAVARGLQRGLLLAVALTVPTCLLLAAVEPVLTLVQQPEAIVPLVRGYIFRVMPAVLPFYAFVVLRQTLQAHHRVAPILVTLVAVNLLNAALNYLWIFGHLGFPAMGVLGSASATLVSRYAMALLLLVLGWRQLAPYLTALAPRVFDVRALRRMVQLGAPIGVQFLLEWGAFGAVGLLMGWLGVLEVAAHQIALNLASLTFMVPMGIGAAAAVRVGQAVGRGDPDAIRRASVASLAVGATFMAVAAALFLSVPAKLASFYSIDPAVVALAALLLPIAGLFQVFDGLQVVAMGLLRGLGDTRVPMIMSIIAFWCVGMPVSLLLAFGMDLGAVGLWWGFVVALAAVAVILLLRLKSMERRKLQRIVIDDHEPLTSDSAAASS